MPYVDRDEQGRIVGRYALAQFIGQEFVEGDAQLYVPLEPQVVAAVQRRLDAFFQSRGYDGVLSAATYATSSVPQFRTEGQFAVDARDAHWAKCYEILAAVQAGQRVVPTLDEVLAEMPALEWP